MEKIPPPYVRKSVFSGVLDRNLRRLESRLGVGLSIRGDSLIVYGRPKKVEFAKLYFEKMSELEDRGCSLREEDFQIALDLLEGGDSQALESYFPAEAICLSRKSVNAKSLNQQEYIQAIRGFDLVFGIGPAGTGKTYLAMAMALTLLQEKQVNRIILTRPAVEAGEQLGFLPGDLYQKINPYRRPLYDALFDMMEAEKAAKLIERGVIEIAPLAFMRGRTLNDSFIILDEAQNTTTEQMKMYLTRLGYNSKTVITGDITQIDLPHGKASGLIEAEKILSGVEGIKFVYFSERDVGRHK